MPSYKQPKSLRDLAMTKVSEDIQETCVAIHNRHTYSKWTRLYEARKLQTHLVTFIWPLLDELCSLVFSCGKKHALCVAADIILTAVTHARMKTLRYPSHPTRHKTSLNWDHGLWESVINDVPNLIELDLSGVDRRIADEILRIIGRKCFRLEIICIAEDKVSQRGLCYLVTVKSLREINNSDPNVLFVTKNANDIPCMRLLLRMLPRLEHIHCSCIGEILCDLESDRLLALKSCWEMQPTPRKIQAIAKLCPELVRLQLGHPSVYNGSFDLETLTTSTLSLSSLKLMDFCFTESLKDYFVAKGQILKELELYNLDSISFEQMRAIGTHCRSLEVLKIDLEELQSPYLSFTSTKKDKLAMKNERLFDKLLVFEFEVNGNSNFIEALIFLVSAERIQTLTFRMYRPFVIERSEEQILDTVLSDLISHNPMTKLQSLILVAPFELSKGLIQYFYDLPNLAAWKLNLDLTPEVDEFFQALKNGARHNNIKLQFI